MKRILSILSLLCIATLAVAQPVLRGPNTTNSPAINAAATGGLIDALTNNFFRVPVQVNTNLIITNLSLGQVIRIEVWPTNGFTVSFPQQTTSNSMQGWVQSLTSNQWNTVYVSRPDSTTTNFDIRAADYIETSGSGITRTTNYAAKTVATAASALISLSTNGTQVTGAWTNLNITYAGEMTISTNTSGSVSMELRASKKLFKLGTSTTVTNTTSPTSFLTNACDRQTVIKANTLTTNMTIYVRARGLYTSTSSTATEFGIRMNNLTLICTNMAALGTTLVNDGFEIEAHLDVRAIGGSGSIHGSGTLWFGTSSGSAVAESPRRMWNGLLSSATTIDTTVDEVLDLYVKPGATSHGFTLTQCLVELIQ